jgi:hypothetical protein
MSMKLPHDRILFEEDPAFTRTKDKCSVRKFLAGDWRSTGAARPHYLHRPETVACRCDNRGKLMEAKIVGTKKTTKGPPAQSLNRTKLTETEYLLKSPRNARRLLSALRRAQAHAAATEELQSR